VALSVARADLTDRQRRIVEFIRAAVDEDGYPPSLREIGAAVGLTSLSSVHHQLRVLEQKGYIRRAADKPRAIKILDGAS
jgi:repressor LexA